MWARGLGLGLKEISPGCSLEGLMLKLKLQYVCHLMQRVDTLEDGGLKKPNFWLL